MDAGDDETACAAAQLGCGPFRHAGCRTEEEDRRAPLGEMRHERVDEKATGNARQRVAQETRCGDDSAAVGDDELRLPRDLGDRFVPPREHHEFGVRGDHEGALVGIETAQHLLGRSGEMDAVEAHAEHVDPRRHDPYLMDGD